MPTDAELAEKLREVMADPVSEKAEVERIDNGKTNRESEAATHADEADVQISGEEMDAEEKKSEAVQNQATTPAAANPADPPSPQHLEPAEDGSTAP